MTFKQELNLERQLEKWREERTLTTDPLRKGLLGNVCEELAKYYRTKNEYEEIDALCNIYVFCMNSLKKRVEDVRNFGIENPWGYGDIIGDFLDYLCSENTYRMMLCMENLVEEKGYEFYGCMLEKIKEMFSKSGKYDEKTNEWIEDTSDEAKAKWYKPDYEKYKI